LANAASIGGIGGGNVRSALVQQGAGFAAQDLQNRYARLANLISGGQNAAAGVGSAAQATGANIGNLLQSGAASQAAGIQQAGQARASGILGAQQANAQLGQSLLGAGFGAAAGSGLLGAGLAGTFGGGAGAGALIGLLSDERLKTDVRDLDLEDCYEAVLDTPLKAWKYIESVGLGVDTHFGPMAQEAPDMVLIQDMDEYQKLSLHDELMMIAGAIQYMKNEGMIKCH
jgi:hypothetical protein